MAENNNGIMDWGDTIEVDGNDYVVLPEGDYVFTVRNFERGRFPGGPKLPACPKAVLTLDVDSDKGQAEARIDLILHRSLQWKLAAFFRCIGQKKHGEKVAMNWNGIVGARGKAHIKPRTYIKDGEERQANDVDRFYDYEESTGFEPVNDPEVRFLIFS
jgi:hypothetical protein